MGKIIENQLGKIEISEEVIATIAGVAASDCYGLVGMSSRNFTDGIAELLGRDANKKGVEVTVANNELIIDINVVLSYGVKINEVANNVMEKVRFSVEQTAGLPVDKVNVNVQGVRITK